MGWGEDVVEMGRNYTAYMSIHHLHHLLPNILLALERDGGSKQLGGERIQEREKDGEKSHYT